MTAPDPRLDEIEANLLAELRKAHEALAAIHTVPPISHGIDADARFANGYNEALRRVHAAVAAAKGDGRECDYCAEPEFRQHKGFCLTRIEGAPERWRATQ